MKIKTLLQYFVKLTSIKFTTSQVVCSSLFMRTVEDDHTLRHISCA
jgi:hypothetical protein